MGWYRKEKWQKNLSVYIVNYRFLSRFAHPLSPNRSNISESTKNISAYMERRKVFFVFGCERFMFLARWKLDRCSKGYLNSVSISQLIFNIRRKFPTRLQIYAIEFWQCCRHASDLFTFIDTSWGRKLSNWLLKTFKQDYKNFVKSFHVLDF